MYILLKFLFKEFLETEFPEVSPSDFHRTVILRITG